MSQILSGVRIVECGHYIAGPRTCQLLADQGAEVIKVEPLTGDPSRRADPLWQEKSLYFFSHNRGKRSVGVNLKDPRGRQVFVDLIRTADAFVTNLSPEAVDKLALDHASLSAINPRLISVQISAYGLGTNVPGPGGVDGTVQSISGMADMIGERDGRPTVTSIPLVDHLTALDAALGLTLALRERDRTGVGQLVDVALYDVAMSVLAYAYSDVLVREITPTRNGSRAPYAFTTTYRAADGYVFIAPMINEMWIALAKVVGHPEWGEAGSPYLDSATRLRDRAVLELEIEKWTAQLTRAQILAELARVGVACAPVNHIDEAIRSPLTQARGMVRWVTAGGTEDLRLAVPGAELKFSRSVADEQEPASVPALGSDTEPILSELGYSAEDLAALRTAGVVA